MNGLTACSLSLSLSKSKRTGFPSAGVSVLHRHTEIMAGCSGWSVYLINIKIHLRKRGWIQSVRKRELGVERESELWFQTTHSITLIPAQSRWLRLSWWIFTLRFIFIYISRQVIVTACSVSFRIEISKTMAIAKKQSNSCIPNQNNLAMPTVQIPPTPSPNTTPNFNPHAQP